MRRSSTRNGLLLASLLGLLLTSTGCKISGWGPGFAGGFVGGLIGAWLGTQGQISTTIERNCFENGVPVDCSQIPPSQAAGG